MCGERKLFRAIYLKEYVLVISGRRGDSKGESDYSQKGRAENNGIEISYNY